MAKKPAGKTSPIVLLHGMGGSQADWKDAGRALTGLTPYAFDLPGAGGEARTSSTFDPPSLARFVLAKMDAEGLETAKGELVRAVERLPSDVRFAALFFDEQVRLWHPEMVPASPTHKADLARFVRGIPRGKRTDVMTPLNAGLAIVAKRVAARLAERTPAPEPVTMVVVSDGQENVRSTPGDAVGDKLERLDLSHAVVHALVLGGKDRKSVV